MIWTLLIIVAASPLIGAAIVVVIFAWADRKVERAFRDLDRNPRYGPPPWPRGR